MDWLQDNAGEKPRDFCPAKSVNTWLLYSTRFCPRDQCQGWKSSMSRACPTRVFLRWRTTGKNLAIWTLVQVQSFWLNRLNFFRQQVSASDVWDSQVLDWKLPPSEEDSRNRNVDTAQLRQRISQPRSGLQARLSKQVSPHHVKKNHNSIQHRGIPHYKTVLLKNTHLQVFLRKKKNCPSIKSWTMEIMMITTSSFQQKVLIFPTFVLAMILRHASVFCGSTINKKKRKFSKPRATLSRLKIIEYYYD